MTTRKTCNILAVFVLRWLFRMRMQRNDRLARHQFYYEWQGKPLEVWAYTQVEYAPK